MSTLQLCTIITIKIWGKSTSLLPSLDVKRSGFTNIFFITQWLSTIHLADSRFQIVSNIDGVHSVAATIMQMGTSHMSFEGLRGFARDDNIHWRFLHDRAHGWSKTSVSSGVQIGQVSRHARSVGIVLPWNNTAIWQNHVRSSLIHIFQIYDLIFTSYIKYAMMYLINIIIITSSSTSSFQR